MLRWRALVMSAERGAPAGDELAGLAGILGHERQETVLLAARGQLRLRHIGRGHLELGQGGLEPREVHVLARDDVLIGVVEVVVADPARDRDVTLAHRQLFLMELAEHGGEVGGLHAFCFCLQLMHTRVQGIASSRAGAMGSPQSRQIPYVPRSIRYSASSMA